MNSEQLALLKLALHRIEMQLYSLATDALIVGGIFFLVYVGVQIFLINYKYKLYRGELDDEEELTPREEDYDD